MGVEGPSTLCLLQAIKANQSAPYLRVLHNFLKKGIIFHGGGVEWRRTTTHQTVNQVHILQLVQSVDEKTGTLGPTPVQLPNKNL